MPSDSCAGLAVNAKKILIFDVLAWGIDALKYIYHIYVFAATLLANQRSLVLPIFIPPFFFLPFVFTVS